MAENEKIDYLQEMSNSFHAPEIIDCLNNAARAKRNLVHIVKSEEKVFEGIPKEKIPTFWEKERTKTTLENYRNEFREYMKDIGYDAKTSDNTFYKEVERRSQDSVYNQLNFESDM